MGKSISILRIFKYMINHKIYGTLYINCKCLTRLLQENEYDKFKKILIDEIPYLFFGDYYEDYFECLNIINKYELKNGNNNLWILIQNIIEFIIGKKNLRKKRYIFIFDQYKDKNDKDHYLQVICKNFLKNEYSIGIISLCSMNNSDIKEYKIQKMEIDFSPLKNNYFTDIYEENDLFDINTLYFEDDDIDDFFDSLGRNIKYYNILKEKEKNKNEEISNYVEKEKSQIKENIRDYYECDKDETNIDKLLKFSTKSKYTLDDFRNKAKYIPFKYFIPKICEDENKNKYISINYAFPLVEEAVNELVYSIIYKDINIYQTLVDKNEIDGGARGILFEKLVTYYLKPNKNENNFEFFKDYKIIDEESVKQFIPKSTEKPKKKKKIRKHLDDGIYLFTQKMTTGKAFDLLIVNIKNNTAKIIAIQVTIHKPDKDIYNKLILQNYFTSLKDYLGKFYDFEYSKNDFSFIYIFDLSFRESNKKEFDSMMKKCYINDVDFILFDATNLKFVDIFDKTVCELNSYVTKVFGGKRKVNEIGRENYFLTKLRKRTFTLPTSEKEKEKIIKILKEDTEFGGKIIGISLERIELLAKMDFKNYTGFDKNKIYLIKYKSLDVSEIIYFSRQNRNFSSKTIGKLETPHSTDLREYCEIYKIELNN